MRENVALKIKTESSIEERHQRNDEAIARYMRILGKSRFKWGVVDFDNTVRDRNFFSEDLKIAADQPLCKSMLDIDPYDTQSIQEAIRNKHILVLGGGRSLEDLTSTQAFAPASLINIDPYMSYENVARSQASYYRSEMFDPTTSDFDRHMKDAGYGTFDEIWCSYSVPHYCASAEEILHFFANAFEYLAPGGNLRIYPIIHLRAEGRELQAGEMTIRDGYQKALDKIAERNDVEISILHDAPDPVWGTKLTLVIHKRY